MKCLAWSPEVLEMVANKITELGGDEIFKAEMCDEVSKMLMDKYGFYSTPNSIRMYIYEFNLKKNKKVKDEVSKSNYEMIRKNCNLRLGRLVKLVNMSENYIVPSYVVARIRDEAIQEQKKTNGKTKDGNKWKFEYGQAVLKKIAREETEALRKYDLEQGKKYLIQEKHENKANYKFYTHGEREFLYMTDKCLFFKHPCGWVESYHRHNGLVRVV